MPELLWTDAQHDAPTVPPPRDSSVSATSIEVPQPRLPAAPALPGPPAFRSDESNTVTPLPAPRRFDPRASAALPLVKRAEIDLDIAWPTNFAPNPQRAMKSGIRPSAPPIGAPGCWSAESSTTMRVGRDSAEGGDGGSMVVSPSVERASSPRDCVPATVAGRSGGGQALGKICFLMTQALPLVRVDHTERLERRAFAERMAIIVVGAMAIVMTMLAIASALTRLGL